MVTKTKGFNGTVTYAARAYIQELGRISGYQIILKEGEKQLYLYLDVNKQLVAIREVNGSNQTFNCYAK